MNRGYFLPLAVAAALAAAGTVQAKTGKNKLDFWLLSSGVDTDATARATLFTNSNRDRFFVDASDLPPGVYDVSVGGAIVGTLTMKQDDSSGGTQGKLKIDPKKGNPLGFDPQGAIVEVSQAGIVFFSCVFPLDSSSIADGTIDVDLVNSGLIPAAEGNAEFEMKSGRTDFSVEIEDVAEGNYDVRVDGVVVGTLTAAPRNGTGAIEGELEFSTDLNQMGEFPLTFDPRGKLVEVVDPLTANVILSVAFPLAPLV